MAESASTSSCKTFKSIRQNETTTGTYHQFIPNVPQDFDCRVQVAIGKQHLDKDLAIKTEQFKSNYNQEYVTKSTGQTVERYGRSKPAKAVNFLRTVQEKYFKDPPLPLPPLLSEMKDSYGMNYLQRPSDEIKAPLTTTKCHVIKLGSEQQPALPIDGKGYWKHLDPYLSSNRCDYILHDHRNELIKGNILDLQEPYGSGNATMFDRKLFKSVLPLRLLTRCPKRVPNSGLKSEYGGNYTTQMYSELYPYLQDSCTRFDESLSPSSRWQDMVAPGIYCSEYCHLGGWPVRCVVAPNCPKKEIKRTSDCCNLQEIFRSQ